jgi:PAS domain S-box-containing protein
LFLCRRYLNYLFREAILIKRPKPIDEEVLFDGRSLISETDLKGVITFVNRKFVEMTGYSKEEAIGQPHSILRHPDMPKAAFEGMWKVIKAGKIWEGYVKNLRKDGKYYWVVVHIVPKKDEQGNIIGYIASRKMPDRHQIDLAIKQYAEMIEAEKQ